MGILQLLAKENYIAYSKPLARAVGIDEAILFGELCSMSNLFGDEFFCEYKRLCDDTCMTEYRVRNALKGLVKSGLLSIEKKGLPAKNYYTLNEDKFLELIECRSTSAIKFDSTGDCKSDTTCDDSFDTTCDGDFDSTFNKNQNKQKSNVKNQISKNQKEPPKSAHKIVKAYPCLDGMEAVSVELLDTLHSFVEMRKKLKSPMTERAMELLMKKLHNMTDGDVNMMIDIINQSIMQGWKGVFPLKDEAGQNQKNRVAQQLEDSYRMMSDWANG